MSLRVKNWHRFQHFKDRKPPWIKLYRDLLDDIFFYELEGEAAKVLFMLWLIASESDGILPDRKELAFRLRMNQKSMNSIISKLSHWLIQDDINVISDISVISDRYQDDPLETETETETYHDRFDIFWAAYPKREGKAQALKAWNRAHINGEFEKVLSALEAQKVAKNWTPSNMQYIPLAATWINGRRWEDEIGKPIPLFKEEII